MSIERILRPVTRREMLSRSGVGFGMLGLAGALTSIPGGAALASDPELPKLAARAKRVIFLFMNGAPSHVDTFDPKPALEKYEGKAPSKKSTGSKSGGFMPSPFKFSAHGTGGVVMSELFPRLALCADDLCVVRSMHTDVPNHEPGLLLMHSGSQQPTRPSFGSWISYGLGTENRNLPSYVVLCPGRPVVGPQLWSCSFLPGEHQGTAVDTNILEVDKLVPNLEHPRFARAAQERQVDLLGRLNRKHLESRPGDGALEAQIRAMETAFRMQVEATDAFDINREKQSTRELYGSTTFGQSCLLARRLVERGVRFVQVYYVTKGGKQPWDTHKDNNGGHRRLCADSDRASAALISDLKARGLLDDTLVIWSGEFGRTPYSQLGKGKGKEKPGRDHHHTGFSLFMAGGGVKGGYTHGSTDEVGVHAVDNRMHINDLHATVLRLMGVDHERLTYRFSGRDFRLTNIAGKVHGEIIA